jgi:hypothetical protein
MNLNYSFFSSKRLFHLLATSALAIVFATSAVAQAIPNGGFENWTTTTWMNPQFYTTSNGNNHGGGSGNIVNAVRVTNAWHGTYAIQLTSVKVGPDTMAGYVVDGNPNGSQVQGGIPYSQIPTGITLHYTYTIKIPDTALIVVWFKLHDTVIATEVMPIFDTTSTYLQFTGIFGAIPKTPDTIVFAAISSNNVFNNGSGRPGSVFTVDSVNFTGVTSQPTMLNGDFENWSPADTAFSLNQWELGGANASRTTDAALGTYALELMTVGPNANNNQNETGYADDGMTIQTSSHNDSTIGGYPYAVQNDSLLFDYKYMPHAVSDSAQINLTFKKNSSIIYYAGWFIGASATYKHMSIPFNVPSMPDSVIVQMQSSDIYVFDTAEGNYTVPDSCVGAIFKIDNLAFGSEPLSVKKITDANGIRVYPNPSTGRFTVTMENNSKGLNLVEVYNMLGEKVTSIDR